MQFLCSSFKLRVYDILYSILTEKIWLLIAKLSSVCLDIDHQAIKHMFGVYNVWYSERKELTYRCIVSIDGRYKRLIRKNKGIISCLSFHWYHSTFSHRKNMKMFYFGLHITPIRGSTHEKLAASTATTSAWQARDEAFMLVLQNSVK